MTQTRMYAVGAVLGLALAITTGCTFQKRGAAVGGGTGGDGIDASVRVEAGPTSVNVDSSVELISSDADTEVGPSVDANCGNMNFSIQAAPPDLLILLDRSGSMDQDESGMMCMGGCGATSKWSQTTTAINDVVAMTETSINWGLKFFANSRMGCTVNAGSTVPVGPMNAAAIAAAIADNANQPGSSTPTAVGVTSASEYLGTVVDPNPKFILLATDGLPNCPVGGNTNTADEAGAIQAVTAAAALGFPTFVIGVATGGSTAETTLSAMAVAGGKPRAGTPEYYPASTTADLVAVLSTIKGMIMGTCTYNVGNPPLDADLTKINVTVDGAKISESATDGWTFGAGMTSVVFNGAICDQLKAGTAKDVRILYGCGVVIQ